MAGFGDVLRGLGSVLNPQVNQDVEGEYQKRQAQQQAMQQFALGQLVKGVESGAVDPSKLPPQLQGIVGQSPETQARVQALKNEQGYRDALAQLGPGANEDQVAQIAVKFGKPEVAAAYAKAKEDRAARIQTAADALEMRRAQLDQQRELALTRAADQKERDAINNQFKQQSLALQGQIAASNAELKRLGLDIQRQGMEQKNGQQTSKQVTQLGAALEKAGLPETNAVITNAENVLKNPDLAQYVTGPKSALPDMMVSPEARDARQAVAKLFNITLKQRSGAAVTDQELTRLKNEFGSGLMKDPNQLLNAIAATKGIVSKHYASIAAGFGPEALKEYNANAEAVGAPVVVSGSAPSSSKPRLKFDANGNPVQ